MDVFVFMYMLQRGGHSVCSEVLHVQYHRWVCCCCPRGWECWEGAEEGGGSLGRVGVMRGWVLWEDVT